MSSTFKNWTSDNYAFVGKAFDFAYADRLNKLSPVVGEVNAKSIDYELTGSGGYGEAPRYDGAARAERRDRREARERYPVYEVRAFRRSGAARLRRNDGAGRRARQ